MSKDHAFFLVMMVVDFWLDVCERLLQLFLMLLLLRLKQLLYMLVMLLLRAFKLLTDGLFLPLLQFSILCCHLLDMLPLLVVKHLAHFFDLSIHVFDQLLVTSVCNSIPHVKEVEVFGHSRTLRGRYLSNPCG